MEHPKDIKVFSTPTCPYCTMAKNYLTSKGFEFEYIDLTQQPEWIPKVVEKSGQMGVPQIWIDDKVIIGFDRMAINTALGLDNF